MFLQYKMKEFIQIIRRFVPPYKKYVILNIFFNILASFLTVFSFFLIVPILKMLFRVDEAVHYTFMPWDWDNAKDIVLNNFYYYIQETINTAGPTLALAGLAGALVLLTGLKVGVTYLCSYIIIPMRSGIVRDIRNYVFDKMVTLPISFFTAARKPDINHSISYYHGASVLETDSVRAYPPSVGRACDGACRKGFEETVACAAESMGSVDVEH